ncbi:hypothetical protein Sste5346_008509 [Sporothrix stenoceras]|uniref:Uncharacterized protein n=1 Tax=Sporothrix stenoceras TaxID=5173 RepID=A0ABR3YPQ4_9PEZI
MRPNTIFASLAGLAMGLVSTVEATKMTSHAHSMFHKEMKFLDNLYDPVAGYLYYFYYPLAAGPHETRSTVWYATGLLQRNEGNDTVNAVRIIKDVIANQEKNVSAQWYGDYTVYPEQPTVGSPSYAPVIYNSWDPNWRGFIGTTLIIIYEEFGSLIGQDVKSLILESLYNNTIGDSYRVGGVDGDNLYPSYSNPSLMRAVVTGWTGNHCNDSNMTAAGEMYAQEIIDLFNMNDTLAEFNVPTYYGVSLNALTLWSKYMPASSVMRQNGPRMVGDIWTAFGDFYNAKLRNLAGPWDRSYGYDMNRYVAIMSLYVWSLVGREHVFSGTGTESPWLLTHADDGEFIPVVATLSEYHRTLVPHAVLSQLTTFEGNASRTVHRQAYTPPFDLEVRNITTWLTPDLQIGGDSYNQTVVGGASQDSTSFSPAVVHWHRNATTFERESVGYLSLHPSEKSMQASVEANRLSLTYPAGNASSIFTFVVSSNPLGSSRRDVYGLADIDGINITVGEGSTVNPEPVVAFCGLVGGTCSLIHNFEFWNLTFTMPANSTALPQLNLNIELP